MSVQQASNGLLTLAYYAWPVPFVAMTDAISIGGFPLGSFTATGILCWYVWHTTSKTMPRMSKEHLREKTDMRGHYQEIIQHQATEMKEQSVIIADAVRDRGNDKTRIE